MSRIRELNNFALILDNSLYEDCFVEEQRLNLVEESPKLAWRVLLQNTTYYLKPTSAQFFEFFVIFDVYGIHI